MSIEKNQIKVEVVYDKDDNDYVFNFIVHFNGEKIPSQVRLPMSVDTLFTEYLDNGYNKQQFKGSLKIYVKHTNI